MVLAEKVPLSTVRYGNRLESTGNLGTDRLFTGQRLDGTGLYYYGARYYDPEIGRFISPDTIVDETNSQSLNRYSYCYNNPLRYTDPSGNWVWIAIAAAAGAAINTATYVATHQGNVTWQGMAVAVGVGAVSGALAVVAGPAAGSICKGLGGVAGEVATNAIAKTAVEAVLNTTIQEAGGVAQQITDTGSYQFDVGETTGDFAFNLVGGAITNRLARIQGVNTLNQMDFLPRSYSNWLSNITSPGKNTLALYKQFGIGAVIQGVNAFTSQYGHSYVDIGNGFKCWGTDSNGTAIIAKNDPSTYSESDWL